MAKKNNQVPLRLSDDYIKKLEEVKEYHVRPSRNNTIEFLIDKEHKLIKSVKK